MPADSAQLSDASWEKVVQGALPRFRKLPSPCSRTSRIAACSGASQRTEIHRDGIDALRDVAVASDMIDSAILFFNFY